MDSYYYIVETIITVDQAKEIVAQLDQVVTKLYSSYSSEHIYDDLSFEIRDRIIDTLKKQQQPILAAAETEAFIRGLIAHIKALPLITLTLVYPPSEKQMMELQKWLETNTGKKILIEAKVDGSIIGGVKVEFQGKYKDYSLKNITQQVITQ